MLSEFLRRKWIIVLCALGLTCSRASLGDVVNDFSTPGWQAATDEDFDHYNVYASTSPNVEPSLADLVGSPKAARFVDWGLEPGSTVYYRVTAVDRQGNESAASVPFTAMTKPD